MGGTTVAEAPAAGTGAALACVREVAPGPGTDRHLAPEIEAVRERVVDGALVAAVEAAIGTLD